MAYARPRGEANQQNADKKQPPRQAETAVSAFGGGGGAAEIEAPPCYREYSGRYLPTDNGIVALGHVARHLCLEQQSSCWLARSLDGIA